MTELDGNGAGAAGEPESSRAPIALHARAGGLARQASRLTVARVRALLTSRTPDAIRCSCETIAQLAVSGAITGATAGAAVRGMEVALKALEATVTFELVEQLRDTVQTLQAERDAAVHELELLRARRSA